jgi:hypothetical protein
VIYLGYIYEWAEPCVLYVCVGLVLLYIYIYIYIYIIGQFKIK